MSPMSECLSPHRTLKGTWVPFAVLGSSLSPGAKLCYGVLAYFAGPDDHCWPSRRSVAQCLNVHPDRVRDYIRELTAGGWIRREARPGSANTYRFLWHPSFAFSSRAKTEQDLTAKEQRKGPGVKTPRPPGWKHPDPRGENTPGIGIKEREEKNVKNKQAIPTNTTTASLGGRKAASQTGESLLAHTLIRKALEPHASAIGAKLDVKILDAIIRAANGKWAAAASLISKTIERKFSPRAPRRQAWPDSLAYWVTVCKEELHAA